ncbi:MAG: class I SAM-dependent methyltransferase [Janthinobacterium lividum]
MSIDLIFGPNSAVQHDTTLKTSDLYSSIATDYDDSYERPTHRRVYDLLAWEHAQSISLPTNACIVDVGCGTGRWISRWLERGHRVIGIELAPGMIAALRARSFDGDFTLIEGRMEDAVIAADSVDLVLALGSVQYAADPEAMIRRFATWLRPGGALCLYVDGLKSLVLELIREGRQEEALDRLENRAGMFREGDHEAPLVLYDRHTLEAHFATAGLVDTRCHGLAVAASALGRTGSTEAMEQDEEAAMDVERALSADPAMADAGLHILAIGFRPL